MSRFLAPIHFWLYDKIKKHEAIEPELIEHSEINGAFLSDLNDRYPGFDLDIPLEEVIDQGNIHGWLQERIAMTERRRDALLEAVPMDKAEMVYAEDAKTTAEAHEGTPGDFPTLQKTINQYLLDGMPCDQLHGTLEHTDTTFRWLTKEAIHAPFWTNMDRYLALRQVWVDTFVKTLVPGLRYTVTRTESGLENTLTKEEK
jgi:hypothetical protein